MARQPRPKPTPPSISVNGTIGKLWNTIASYNLRGILIIIFIGLTGLGGELAKDWLEAARELSDGRSEVDPLTITRAWRWIGLTLAFTAIMGGIILITVQDFKRMLEAHKSKNGKMPPAGME